MEPRYDRDREEEIVKRHEVVERDTGTGMGVVLGVILAVILAVAVLWFLLGANLFGPGGTTAPPSGGNPPVEQPAQPGGGMNPPSGGQPGGDTSPSGGTNSGGATP